MKTKLICAQLLMIIILPYNSFVVQEKIPIKFSYQYLGKNHDTIKLSVENVSKRTYYYSIALQGYIDTAWVPLLSDINSLGENEFLVLKSLKPGSRAAKEISKKRINYLYSFKKIKKIRFGVMYYEKQDLDSKGDIIYLSEMELK